MKQFLHTKYRPRTFDEVVGQDYVMKILKKQVETNTFKNCYLFTGPAGCSKTTSARILANEINKGKGDPIEIDAASNSSVDDVRRITEEAKLTSLDSYYKVYILDECHSFSDKAWQAFLLCLEEPPARTIFIFCTTDAQKIPATILSRIQRYDIKRIPLVGIIERLKYICEQEKFEYDDEAINYIAKLSEGGMRDAITALDKTSSFNNNITLANVIEALGVADYGVMFELTNFIIDQKELECLNLINKLHEDGKDLKLFLSEYIYFILDIAKYIIQPNFDNIKIPIVYKEELENAIYLTGAKSFYNRLIDNLVAMKDSMKWETKIKSNLELNLLKLCRS